MTDLVERYPLVSTLRVRAWKTSTKVDQRLFGEAADRIETLEAGLRTIADWRDGSPQPDSLNWQRIAKAMRENARAALSNQPRVRMCLPGEE